MRGPKLCQCGHSVEQHEMTGECKEKCKGCECVDFSPKDAARSITGSEIEARGRHTRQIEWDATRYMRQIKWDATFTTPARPWPTPDGKYELDKIPPRYRPAAQNDPEEFYA